MPGGYGTDEDSTPWGSAGISYVTPGQSSSPYQPGGGSTNQGGSNFVADAVNAYQQNPTPQNQQVAQAAIAEQTPIEPWRTQGQHDIELFKELAALAATDPKYDESFYAPNTLGKFIATDRFGKPILDSSGNPVLTGLGKHIQDQGQGGINLENLQGIEKEYYAKRQAEMDQQTGGNNYGYGYGYSYPSSKTVAGGYEYGFGDPVDIGKTYWDYGEPYSEARYASDPMMKFMVDTHSPMYAARGGIMNLRR